LPPTATGSVANDDAPSAPACTAIRRRREIRTLSKEERTMFVSAIRQLQSGPQPNEYDRIVSLHWNARKTAHGWPAFLPWHRAYVREFERRLQSINPTIAVPYWDWTYDSQAPEMSPIWKADWFGGVGRQSDGCVVDGPFAKWRPYYPTPHCLLRVWDGGNFMTSFHSPEVVSALSVDSTSYVQYNRRAEAPQHDKVHIAVGGDMVTIYSPNDPVFWLHHAFVDKLWWEWQRQREENYEAYSG
ncbi:hypothetical protein THASP1DRAFT_2882, partial [Thamnocephalis sphaerospora]